tara:strand:+ start:715 stop:843 length:129 start_codon:yes stop_codon:yes gene_type:complete
MLSKNESLIEKPRFEKKKGKEPKPATAIQVNVENKNVCLRFK